MEETPYSNQTQHNTPAPDTNQTSSTRATPRLPFILAGTVIIIAGFTTFLYFIINNNPINDQDNEKAPNGWVNYRNDNICVTFSHPAQWVLNNQLASTNGIVLDNFQHVYGQGGLIPKLGVELSVVRWGATQEQIGKIVSGILEGYEVLSREPIKIGDYNANIIKYRLSWGPANKFYETVLYSNVFVDGTLFNFFLVYNGENTVDPTALIENFKHVLLSVHVFNPSRESENLGRIGEITVGMGGQEGSITYSVRRDGIGYVSFSSGGGGKTTEKQFTREEVDEVFQRALKVYGLENQGRGSFFVADEYGNGNTISITISPLVSATYRQAEYISMRTPCSDSRCQKLGEDISKFILNKGKILTEDEWISGDPYGLYVQYTNHPFGFSVSYPKGFRLVVSNEVPKNSDFLFSIIDTYYKNAGQEAFQLSREKITNEDPRDRIDKIISTSKNGHSIKERIELDNRPTVKVLFEDGGGSIYTVRDGFIYHISWRSGCQYVGEKCTIGYEKVAVDIILDILQHIK